jgi:3-oxoacyl-[acyl-carrier protein] reductase
MLPLIRRSQSAVPRHAGEDGASVSGLLPVRIAADGVRQLDALRGDPDELRARLSEHIPLRRYGEPEEFSWAAAFVLSPPRPTSPAR